MIRRASCALRSALLASRAKSLRAPALAIALVLLPGISVGETRSSSSWSPGLTIRSGVIIEGFTGDVDSTLTFATQAPLRPSDSGSQIQVWPMIGLDLEILTPSVDLIPGKPRFFARGGTSYTFASDKDLAKEENPDLALFEASINQLPPPSFADLYRGLGSKATIEPEYPIWDASLGIAFDFEVLDRPLRLRLSGEYMRQRLGLTGEVYHAQNFYLPPNAPPDPPDRILEFTPLRDSTQEDFDAVGGGVGLEFDAMRAGDFISSVLAETRLYGWVGGRTIRTSQTGTERTLPVLQTDADWQYKLDRVVYRVHVGLKIRWDPE